MMTLGKLVFGTAIAMTTGAVLGMLFASDKGASARKRLAKQGTRAIDALGDTAHDYVEALEKNLEGLQDTADDITEKMKGAVNTLAGTENSR